METALKWVDKAYGVIIGFAIIWGGWYFAKSHKLKKADDDSAAAKSAKEWTELIRQVQEPLLADNKKINEKLDILQDNYIKVQIKVGILEGDLSRKERELEYKDNEIKALKQRIKELEAA